MGVTEVQVPQFPKIKDPNDTGNNYYDFMAGVRYVVPESGTYKIEFSDYNCRSKASVKTWTFVTAFAATTPWSAQSGTIAYSTYLTDMTDKERKDVGCDYEEPFSKLKFTAEKGEDIKFDIPKGGNIKKLKKEQGNNFFPEFLPEVRKSYTCKIKLKKV